MRWTLTPLVFPLLFACQSEPETPPPDVDQQLVVASDLDHMPFIGRDEEGRPIGRDVDMMEAVAAALEIPIQWEVASFAEILPMVEAGAVDIGCATIGVTPERGLRVAFSQPYYKTSIAVVVRSAEGQPRSFADLANRRVGCAIGTTSERAVRSLLPDAICLTDEKEEATTLERLLSGDLDAAAMDAPDADELVKQSEGALMRMRRDLDQERYALAIRSGRPHLLAKIDRVLQSMEDSGQMGTFDQNWGL